MVATKKGEDQMLPIFPRRYVIICSREVAEFNFWRNFYILLSGVSLEEEESCIGHLAKIVFDLQCSRTRSFLGRSFNPTPYGIIEGPGVKYQSFSQDGLRFADF